MKYKSEKSVSEIQMKEILDEAEEIIDDSYLKTRDARKILDAGYKLLLKCEEIRKSRDNWRDKHEKIKYNNLLPRIKQNAEKSI